MLHLSAGGPVCVNGRVVSASGERVWCYVRNLDWCYRLWVALCQDDTSFGSVCEWEGSECIW